MDKMHVTITVYLVEGVGAGPLVTNLLERSRALARATKKNPAVAAVDLIFEEEFEDDS